MGIEENLHVPGGDPRPNRSTQSMNCHCPSAWPSLISFPVLHRLRLGLNQTATGQISVHIPSAAVPGSVITVTLQANSLHPAGEPTFAYIHLLVMPPPPVSLGAEQGISNLSEPMGTFGILVQGDGHKMAASEGGANFKMSGSKVVYSFNSSSSTFQAGALLNRVPFVCPANQKPYCANAPPDPTHFLTSLGGTRKGVGGPLGVEEPLGDPLGRGTWGTS